MESKQTATGLITTGSKRLGGDLLEAAQKQNRENVQKVAVGEVQNLLVQLDKQRSYRANVDANIELLEEKIAAVKAGEFTVDIRGFVTLDDSKLRQTTYGLIECPNCGATVSGSNRSRFPPSDPRAR